MVELNSQFSALLETLGLEPHDETTGYGRRGGFVVSVRLMPLDHGVRALLIQVRQPSAEPPRIDTSSPFGPRLSVRFAQNVATVASDSKNAWLTLSRAANELESCAAVGLIDDFLHHLVVAGFDTSEACHGCGTHESVQLGFHAGNVEQMCPPCVQRHAKVWAAMSVVRPEVVSKVVLHGGLALAAGAVMWLTTWYGIDLLIGLLGFAEDSVPMELLLALCVGVGLAAAWPVGSLLRRSRLGAILSQSIET